MDETGDPPCDSAPAQSRGAGLHPVRSLTHGHLRAQLQSAVRAPLRSSTTGAFFCLVIVGVLLVVWNSHFDFHVLMGDDLWGWAFYAGNPSYEAVLLGAPGGKYRPVISAVQLVLFDLLSSDYRAWFNFNIALAFLIASVQFGLVRKLTRQDNLIALVAALLFVTSRFSYFNVLQALGALEALSLLLLLIIMWTAIIFLRGRSTWPGYALAGLYLVVTFTHERYLALLPFMLLVVIFRRHLTKFARAGLLVAMLVPPILNLLVKQLVNADFLMGTGGQALSLEPDRFAEFVMKGLANMLWINAGPQNLSGIPWESVGSPARLLVGVILVLVALVIVASVVRVLGSRRRGVRIAEFRGFLLFMVLLAALLISASVTIRQEQRWLYAPFVVCVTYVSYLASRLRLPQRAKFVGLAVLTLCVLSLDLYYLRFAGNVFFISGQHYAESLYDATVGRFGAEMRDYSIYIADAQPEDRWFLQETLFFTPYLGRDYQRIAYLADAQDVAALPQLDRTHTLVFKRDSATRSYVDVTEEVLGDE